MDWDLTCGISIPAGEAKAAKNLSTGSAASIEFKGMEKGDVIHFIRNRTMSDATSHVQFELMRKNVNLPSILQRPSPQILDNAFQKLDGP